MPVGRTGLLKAIQGICDTNSAGPYATAKVYSGVPNPGLLLQNFGYLGIPISEAEVRRSLAAPGLALPVAHAADSAGVAEVECGDAASTPKTRVKNKAARDSGQKAARARASDELALHGKAGEISGGGTSFEIDAGKITVKNQRFCAWVKEKGKEVSSELGVEDTGGVSPQFQKMIICPQGGGHIADVVARCQGEGMFATMLVLLTSPFTGGGVAVDHKGHRTTLWGEAACSSATKGEFPGFDGAAVLAWYVDVERSSMEKVIEGFRISLVYGLVYNGARNVPKAPTDFTSSPAMKALRKTVESWSKEYSKSRQHFLWLLEHPPPQGSSENYQVQWRDTMVGDSLRFAIQGLPIGLELVSIESGMRLVRSETFGSLSFEKHDVIQPDLLPASKKAFRLHASSLGDVMLQMKKNGRTAQDRLAHFRGSLEGSTAKLEITDCEATELKSVILELSGSDYNREIVDFLAITKAVQAYCATDDSSDEEPQGAPRREPGRFALELARAYCLEGPQSRMLNFLIAPLPENGASRLENTLRQEGCARVDDIKFWSEQAQWNESNVKLHATVIQKICNGAVREALVGQLLSQTSPIRKRLSVSLAIAVLRKLSMKVEALHVAEGLLRANGDVANEPNCGILRSLLSEFATAATLAPLASIDAAALQQLNKHLISLDNQKVRTGPVQVRSSYAEITFQSLLNHCSAEIPKQDPLLNFFKSLDANQRVLLREVALFLLAQYETLCAKPQGATAHDYSGDAGRVRDPELQRFLRNPAQQELHLNITKERRKEIHRELDGKGIDVSHTSEGCGRQRTMVIRKLHSSAEFSNMQQSRDRQTLQWLRDEVERLGTRPSATKRAHGHVSGSQEDDSDQDQEFSSRKKVRADLSGCSVAKLRFLAAQQHISLEGCLEKADIIERLRGDQ